MKRLIIFDLDGTLAPSKARMDKEMALLLVGLLQSRRMVAIISGGKYAQFQKQILPVFAEARVGEELKNLFLFPTCGAAFYKFVSLEARAKRSAVAYGDLPLTGWQEVYAENLADHEKNKIKLAFSAAFNKLNYEHPKKVFGEILEDRETQITFSALGQSAPLELKEIWDPDSAKRLKIIGVLAPLLSEFDLAVGGTTSIDVLHKGINKAYGIKKMEEYLGVTKSEMLFMGDKVFPGGNDYAAKVAGVDCIQVANPEVTKKEIARILKGC